MRLHSQLLLIILCFFVSPAFANYVLTSPPRETPEKGQEIYKPIADYLSKVTGQNIVYQHPGSWKNYSSDMRDNKYDIVFDGPHFAAWRMRYLEHKPLVRLRGDLKFHVVIWADRKDISSIYDIAKLKACGIAPPNLSTLSFLSTYRYDSEQPELVKIRGGMKKVYQAFKDGKCDAAVIRESFYNKKINLQEQARIKIIYTIGPLPNQALTVSSRVDEEMAQTIQNSLSKPEGVSSAKKLLTRFSKQNPTFKTANFFNYLGTEWYLKLLNSGW